ncbi:MAG: AtzE family amidohydrolase [Candidatus Competibacterales bacterium]
MAPNPTAFTSAAAIAQAVAAGDTSATAVVEGALGRIAAHDQTLNAFTHVARERALARAAELDARRARGEALGPLAGVPFGVKNLFDVRGIPTLAGSKINRDRPPAQGDAELIHRLEAADAVLVGALNMGEYAYDFTGENPHYGPSRNPVDPSRMSGGSSGGSGAAVGAGLVPLALGSDTNGSIRVPAALCGTFGLKPTYGHLSRRGTFLFCPSLDHLGPLGRSVADLALAFDAMQGVDPADPACSAPEGPNPTFPTLQRGIDGLRLAVADDYFRRGATPEALGAVEQVAKTLGVTQTATFPEAARARAAGYIITASAASQLHLERLRRRAADFDPLVRDRLMAGATFPAAWYLHAQRFRRWYAAAVAQVFTRVDVVIAPTTPCSAPAIGQQTMVLDGLEVQVRPNLGLYTQPISLAGLPVGAVPVAGYPLPVGVQLIAAPGREAHALAAAAALEGADTATPTANPAWQ